ncbi:hypothetical protein [Algoriphagus machipongonensis]|uniref:Uncharacterized protein n=1 Tax=Algoriphagus machipongonensis TaxID=388413 RepID=A3I330_9BACT|nr:hypothetical protein [Algoriphagus machipongonensis]EAZ79229.1 hypothetical protein ALPR1_14199 [Algoriphagus machipongonensis]
MEPKRLISLMTFPQRFDGNTLTVHIVVVPRNTNPFSNWATGLANPANVPGFANFQPEFNLGIVRGTDDFPLSNATSPSRVPIIESVEVIPAANKANMIKKVAEAMPLPITDNSDKLPPPVPVESSIKKYLPLSYRERFNFTQPRHPNAITDDGYHCAVRDKIPTVNYKPREKLSWGKVFANILRQPLLAKACGMIYEVSIKVKEEWFEDGGYLYADITNDPYSSAQLGLLDEADGPLIKRYAAKIPALTIGEKRPVFAPVLFPVLYKKSLDPAEPVPLGPWDELFMEAQTYSDGFAKIVHANQPVSGNLLEETQDELPPQSDAGIRLGWDDEQLLVWYLRQMIENPSAQGSGERIDAPLGVMGYHIDVRKAEEGTSWESLNQVEIEESQNMFSGQFDSSSTELPYQVYPNKISGPNSDHYWLPMYYAHWIGKNIVTEDQDAIEIYRNHEDNGSMLGEAQQKKVAQNKALKPGPLETQLRYGNTYEFRIRMTDISGGGPSLTDDPINAAPSPETSVSFKRYINPSMLRIDKPFEIRNNQRTYFNAQDDDETQFDANPNFVIKRPLLEYPAVVFTDKYQGIGEDPVALLKAVPIEADGLKPALSDPDVTKVKVRVEVRTLKMDTQLSQKGDENYITLYETTRDFPEKFDETLTIPMEFIDVPVLNLGEPANPFLRDDLLLDDIHDLEGLVLPTGRHIRISLRAVAETESSPESYFGFIDEDEDKDSRYGKNQQFMLYKEPSEELDLLQPFEAIAPVQALFLKPDSVPTIKGDVFKSLLIRESEDEQSGVVERLANALGVEAKGLTLVAPKGERIVFGCNSRIRHTLAPDGSSITFATKSDLYNHWVATLSYKLNRDWAWDSLKDVGFVIEREFKFRKDKISEKRKNSYLGDLEFKHTVSFEALQSDSFDRVNRNYTRIVYIDALDPKNELKQNNGELRFPDELWASYKIKPMMKDGHPAAEEVETDQLSLPTVLPPAQVPKMVSVGIAFSPYERAEDYSASEARKRYLWIEFDKPVENPDDTYFCRMLANAPDQLLASNEGDQLVPPEESPLSLDPELTRTIIPGQSDDKAGIGAMQPMIKANDSETHYMLPIPAGMHAESPEMFGFFTYEFRVGHGHWADREDNLWSTAQGRYGRPLRVTGIQHPVPTLLCSLNRNENHLYVSAPFAKAVFNGKNVTSKPPRTSLWTLVYAQVYQADGRDFRNILLGEIEMKIGVRINTDPKVLKAKNDLTQQVYFQPTNGKYTKGSVTLNPNLIRKGNLIANIKDEQPVGTAVVTSEDIAEKLRSFGLPEDSPLSVLVVEVFGNITNIHDHLTHLRPSSRTSTMSDRISKDLKAKKAETNLVSDIRPLSRGLGHFRILRTSPLTKVPFVCCPTC